MSARLVVDTLSGHLKPLAAAVTVPEARRIIDQTTDDDTPAVDAWEAAAACRTMDPDVFFPPTHNRRRRPQPGTLLAVRVAAAKAVCSNCPVRAECLAHALTVGEEHGIWGGYDEDERRQLRRGRARIIYGTSPCGTNAGYCRHRRDGTDPCWACLDAHARYEQFKPSRHPRVEEN